MVAGVYAAAGACTVHAGARRSSGACSEARIRPAAGRAAGSSAGHAPLCTACAVHASHMCDVCSGSACRRVRRAAGRVAGSSVGPGEVLAFGVRWVAARRLHACGGGERRVRKRTPRGAAAAYTAHMRPTLLPARRTRYTADIPAARPVARRTRAPHRRVRLQALPLHTSHMCDACMAHGPHAVHSGACPALCVHGGAGPALYMREHARTACGGVWACVALRTCTGCAAAALEYMRSGGAHAYGIRGERRLAVPRQFLSMRAQRAHWGAACRWGRQWAYTGGGRVTVSGGYWRTCTPMRWQIETDGHTCFDPMGNDKNITRHSTYTQRFNLFRECTLLPELHKLSEPRCRRHVYQSPIALQSCPLVHNALRRAMYANLGLWRCYMVAPTATDATSGNSRTSPHYMDFTFP
ncbi:hypothetical protein GGX14DRAFT_391564 [Mycena pura]|uniref:Uncharacterized protein n=1 Tax=Mycena pura TaxID=153505 RepID=A0AAD6VLM4_9AGAR|nr:hypothetical protein GGX14DRAFT_391564 [Mycena pura]